MAVSPWVAFEFGHKKRTNNNNNNTNNNNKKKTATTLLQHNKEVEVGVGVRE
jgi:hypothetical protein